MASDINNKNKTRYTLVFGLTADPIHKGHEQVILNSFEFAQQQGIAIDEFILVPTYHPNLIAGKQQPGTAFKHRFAMCEIVAKKMRNNLKYGVYVSDIEKYLYIENKEKSYSHDTLKAIKKTNKLFVLSADHFAGRWPKFRKWYNWQNLVKQNGLLIHQRPGHGINLSFVKMLQNINEDVFVVINYPQVNISSTELRNQLKTDITVSDDYISTQVMMYINENQIYNNP
jgi:nicotinate-nucleotide adenylyltransferase